MKHIFISHAGADAVTANRLAEDLRNAGHETKVDTRELKLGDDPIEFMNQGIADACTVIILYSQHTQQANWQKLEINSALWNEVAQEGGVCIVVRLDDAKLPPVLGPKLYGKLDPTIPDSYKKLIEELCGAILPQRTASSVVSDATRLESANPFRRVRAEYFEDRPDLLAKTFAPPDALTIGALEEMKPCLLEGSRGTGKSMLLLSLRARNFLSRPRGSGNPYRIFGFYLKLSRGAICNAGILSNANSDPKAIGDRDTIQIADVASQEIIVCLLESLLSEVAICISQDLLPCERPIEKALAESVHSALFIDSSSRPKSLDELLEKLAETHVRVADFIRRRFIYGEQPLVPVATFDLDALKRVIRMVRKLVPTLADSMFVALLDEYENLFPYQQRVVNGFVKLAPPDVSVKIAKKLGSSDSFGTTTGQELQEIHDYTRLPLVYDVEDPRQLSAYHELLKHIVGNILRSENLGAASMTELLPEDASPEVDSGKLLTHRKGIPVSGVDVNPVAALLSHVKLNGFSPKRATQLANELISVARKTSRPLPVRWPAKHYWFTPTTLDKFERLRASCNDLKLTAADDGTAVLLSFALSVRLCSKADQRSPKPFISKQAKEFRRGRHFDPYCTLLGVLDELAELYGHASAMTGSRFLLANVACDPAILRQIGKHSHVITSPPYINAQDYFRNFKLELYLLEDVLPFQVEDLRDRFIGTERGNLLAGIPDDLLEDNYEAVPSLRVINRRGPRLGAVVHRYLYDMGRAFDSIKGCLEPKACFVLVCGDNLVGGIRIRTWQALKRMLEERRFRLFDQFSDPIGH